MDRMAGRHPDCEQTEAVEDSQAVKKPRVLVVDNDETHQKLFELLSDKLGVSAHKVYSCTEALAAIGNGSFDLILMDYRMPDVDGCTCTKKIRDVLGDTDLPILGVTADIRPETLQSCLDAGMDDVFTKPFTLDELQTKLDYWLKRSAPQT